MIYFLFIEMNIKQIIQVKLYNLHSKHICRNLTEYMRQRVNTFLCLSTCVHNLPGYYSTLCAQLCFELLLYLFFSCLSTMRNDKNWSQISCICTHTCPIKLSRVHSSAKTQQSPLIHSSLIQYQIKYLKQETNHEINQNVVFFCCFFYENLFHYNRTVEMISSLPSLVSSQSW